jgi:diguanylate cyclase (GGDEF)-like protein
MVRRAWLTSPAFAFPTVCPLTNSRIGVSRLLVRFLRWLLPIFVIVAIAALWFVESKSFGDERSAVGNDVGNISARLTTAVGKLPLDAGVGQFESVLAIALSEASILCVELKDKQNKLIAAAPPRVGCTGQERDAHLVLPVINGDRNLTFWYSSRGLEERNSMIQTFTLMALFASMIIATLASLASFRVVVGRPIHALVSAIQQTRATSKPVLVNEMPDDELGEVIAAFNDMQSRMEEQTTVLTDALRQISRQAVTDHLTGLNNRKALADHMTSLSGHWTDLAGRGALMFIDLDNFKPINDGFGHETGDIILKGVAERLSTAVPDDAFVARLGGDEFAVVLGQGSAEEIADKILVSFSRPFKIFKNLVNIGASIGICHFNEARCADEALRFADMAMYKAKEAGKNCVARVEGAQSLFSRAV